MSRDLSEKQNLSALQRNVTEATLKLLAGKARLGRGEDLFRAGKVSSVEIFDERITAQVSGQKIYFTELYLKGQSLGGGCDCPDFDPSHFCKHWVALGYIIINSATPKREKTFIERILEREHAPRASLSKRQASQVSVGLEEVRNFLFDLSRESLVERLLNQADHNSSLWKELVQETRSTIAPAESPSEEIDPAHFYDAIEAATDTSGFVSYRECYSFAQGIDRVLESFVKTLRAQSRITEEWLDLVEYFIAAVERALNSVDSSDGSMNHFLEDLPELHLEICRRLGPDPKKLASRLFSWSLHSGFGCFSHAVRTYQDLLGAEGLAEFRRLAAQEWKKVPPRLTRTLAIGGAGALKIDSFYRHRKSEKVKTPNLLWICEIKLLCAIPLQNES